MIRSAVFSRVSGSLAANCQATAAADVDLDHRVQAEPDQRRRRRDGARGDRDDGLDDVVGDGGGHEPADPPRQHPAPGQHRPGRERSAPAGRRPSAGPDPAGRRSGSTARRPRGRHRAGRSGRAAAGRRPVRTGSGGPPERRRPVRSPAGRSGDSTGSAGTPRADPPGPPGTPGRPAARAAPGNGSDPTGPHRIWPAPHHASQSPQPRTIHRLLYIVVAARTRWTRSPRHRRPPSRRYDSRSGGCCSPRSPPRCISTHRYVQTPED